DAQRYLNTVRADTQQMGRLIDDLLTFSRLSRQDLKKQNVNPTEIVNFVLADMRLELGERQIEFRVAELPRCQADPALLKQVYVNLLSNAAKYTRKCENAVVEVGSSEENGETVYYVKDNGVGFNMRYAHKLFKVFQRLHSADDYEGTGVGLAIIQRVINRHGGRVWAEAEPNKGASFYFTLSGGQANG
ncbi:MAG TPA: ATP-binding protein, partial [Phototrophicaceae bacterium]|nr:ATP-binding protein [Phototrophicaceae bacterium]